MGEPRKLTDDGDLPPASSNRLPPDSPSKPRGDEAAAKEKSKDITGTLKLATGCSNDTNAPTSKNSAPSAAGDNPGVRNNVDDAAQMKASILEELQMAPGSHDEGKDETNKSRSTIDATILAHTNTIVQRQQRKEAEHQPLRRLLQ